MRSCGHVWWVPTARRRTPSPKEGDEEEGGREIKERERGRRGRGRGEEEEGGREIKERERGRRGRGRGEKKRERVPPARRRTPFPKGEIEREKKRERGEGEEEIERKGKTKEREKREERAAEVYRR